MASTNGGPENKPLGRQELPGKQELITMLTVRDQILRAAEPKAAMGNLDDADTPEVIRVEVAFALRNFPELREELDAQQALLQKLLEVDRAARQRKKNEEVTDEQADEAGEQIAFSGHRDDVSEHSNLEPESAEEWAATSGDDEAAPPLANDAPQVPEFQYLAQWSRWAGYGARDHVVVDNVIYPILDPKLYGGNELHNLGLCAKAWSSEPGVSCPEDWTTCPLRHWQIELIENWVDATFLRRSLELNLPVHCPDHPDVSYEGRARLSWDLRVFRSSREGFREMDWTDPSVVEDTRRGGICGWLRNMFCRGWFWLMMPR